MTVLADRYQMGVCLGAGGMAQVFRAHDLVLGRDVAVKVFGPGIDPNSPARARGEIRTLAGLSHPNLVMVHDAGADTSHTPARAYLVMQLIDGPSLADLLKDGPLPDTQVRQIGVGVARALAYVHERGVVHRDLKPGNILLDGAGRAYLADFGIAQTLGTSALTATGQTVGTAAYLSPEQVRGREVGPASDTFGFGLVLLEALTGAREYVGSTAETAVARLSRPPVIAGRVPAAWTELLTAMTDADPARRPSSAQVAQELAGLAQEPSVESVPAPDSALVTTATAALTGLGGAAPTRLLGRPSEAPTTTGRAFAGPADRDLTTVLSQAGATRAYRVPTRSPEPVGPSRPSGPGRWRRVPVRFVLGAAIAVVVVIAAAVALSGGTHSAGSAVPPAPTGTPGPARLTSDLSRLQQLVKP